MIKLYCLIGLTYLVRYKYQANDYPGISDYPKPIIQLRSIHLAVFFIEFASKPIPNAVYPRVS